MTSSEGVYASVAGLARAAIVVVNYGSHALIDKNFRSRDLIGLNATLYIVDNFTTPAERAAIAQVCDRDRWVLVPSERNEGFGAGVNRGVRQALSDGAQSLLIVNPDLEISDAVALQLLADVQQQPRRVVSPAIDSSAGKPWFRGGDLNVSTGAVRTSQSVDMSLPHSWLSGACVALDRSIWEASGGFDPDYFLYWEDLDFSQRCRRAGAQLALRSDLLAVHAVGGTQGHGKSPVYTYYNCRNRLLYAAKWLDTSQRRLWVRHTPSRSYEILLRGGRRALVQWSQVSAALRGSFAGLRLARKARGGAR